MNSLKENQNNEIHPEKIGSFLSRDEEDNKFEGKDAFGTNNKNTKRKRIIAGIVIFLLAVIGLGFYSYFYGQHSFDAQKVEVTVLGPEEIMSGKENTYQIKYTNNTKVNLKNSRVLLNVPDKLVLVSSNKNFKKELSVITWDLGELKAGETGIIEIVAKVIGPLDSEYNLDSKMLYTPANFNSEFQSAGLASRVKIKITSVPFKVSILSPKSTISGGEVKTLIKYQNISQTEFHKIEIKAVFPEGFVFDSSSPAPFKKEDNWACWIFETVKPDSVGEVEIMGGLNGEKGKTKKIKTVLRASETEDALMAKYLEENSEIIITEAPLIVSQTVNGLTDYVAQKNEELEYKIKYQNVSNQEIKGLVINSVLDGSKILDFETLKVANGSYDDQHKITWSAFNVPELAVLKPGQEGEVSFKIKLRDYFEIKEYQDKNFTIKNTVTVKNFNFSGEAVKVGKIIASSEMETPVSAGLFLKTAGYYNDDGRIENDGPIPPTIGETTTYTIHWYLNSIVNDLDGIEIAAVLPEQVEWTGKYILNDRVFSESDSDSENKKSDGESNKNDQESLAYYSDTREVVWKIPLLPANTGILSPVKEITFQVALTPIAENIGKSMILVNRPSMVARDKFTDLNLTGEGGTVTTELLDDESVGEEEGIVVADS